MSKLTHRLGKVGGQVNERPREFHARFPTTSFVSMHCVVDARYVQCLDSYQRRLLEHRLQAKGRQSYLIVVGLRRVIVIELKQCSIIR